MNRSRKNNKLYSAVIVISAVFIVSTVLHNFLFDPNAASFLSHKTHLTHPLHIRSWLDVLRVHIVFACLAMITGAVNFSSKIRRNNRRFHRVNGYAYIICVMAVCVISGYLAPTATGGEMNSVAFNLMNVLWLGATVTAFIQIKRKRISSHRIWMVRSYMFCYTNLLIHVLMFAFSSVVGITYDLSYTLSVYGSIVLNVIMSSIAIRLFYMSDNTRITKPFTHVVFGDRDDSMR